MNELKSFLSARCDCQLCTCATAHYVYRDRLLATRGPIKTLCTQCFNKATARNYIFTDSPVTSLHADDGQTL